MREFKGMVKALHRAGIEVILDVVYNHTAEGNHLGPMLGFKGVDNAVLLPADARRPALLHGLHRHGQQPQPGAPERAPPDHGLAPLLRDRLPRRRVPLRPRLGAGARVLRRRPPVGVLRHDPPGPGAVAGEADRRAVGRRARAATRSGTSRSSGRSGTGIYRDSDARLLARPGRPSPSSRSASPAPATSTSRTAAGRPRRSTSSPRTTASRSTTSSRTTRSTTRRTSRTTATAPTTTAAGTAASRARPTIPRSTRLRERQLRNFLTTLFLSQGVPMLLGGDELGAYAAREQQRLLPGQRDQLVRLGARATVSARLLRFTRRLIHSPRRPSRLPADAVPDRATRRSAPACPTAGGSGQTAAR